jgi:hypothetical protein
VVFLSETQQFSNLRDGLQRSLGFPFGMGVGSYGRGGGLALLCIGEVKMKLESCDKLHIYVVVLNPETIIMRCGVSLGSTVSRKESFTIVVGI